MRRTLLVAVLAAIFLTTGVCACFAQPPEFFEKKGPEFREKIQQRLTEELDLNAEQQELFKEKQEKYGEKTKELVKELHALHEQLGEEIGAEKTDKRKVDSLIKKISAVKEKLFKLSIDNVLATKEILTPEQFEKFQEHRKKKEMMRKDKIRGKMDRCPRRDMRPGYEGEEE